jgi:Transglutaminase-like superfamily/Coenzyme PQQ synthesis protein D (PqqD)
MAQAVQTLSPKPVEPVTSKRDASLHLRITDDGGILLDLDHDRLLKLNVVSVEMWKLIAQGDEEEKIVRKVADRYQVDRTRVSHDLRALLDRLAELNLRPRGAFLGDDNKTVSKTRPSPTFPWYFQDDVSSRPRAPLRSVLAAFFALALFDLVLSLSSLKGACRGVKACLVSRRTQQKAEAEIVGEVCSAIEEACVWYPRKALCLQRSAVTTCLLRRRGVAARLVLGVRPVPLMAHAWVEVDGRPVNDWPKVGAFYDSITSY